MTDDTLVVEIVHPRAVREIKQLAARLDITVDDTIVFLLGMAMQQAEMMGLVKRTNLVLDPTKLNDEEKRIFKRMIEAMRPTN